MPNETQTMNHCRKCDSDYEAPGTCNCFAPARATESADYWRGYADGQRSAGSLPVPYPCPTWVPVIPQIPQPWYGTLTVTCGDDIQSAPCVGVPPDAQRSGFCQIVDGSICYQIVDGSIC